MTTRSEREKAQKLNEQHQAILSKLLREDENKYCADCEAKGPRWASWNLGVFMCIRCAGIHRNLGVHISRVKSVNLDQWTPEQIQSMVDMGNGRAKQLYEAHLPENFSRPQTDQSVEVFIRDKYERKKYYDKESVATALKSGEGAPHSNSPSFQADRSKQEKEHEKKRDEKKKEKDLEKADRHNVKSESRASPKKNQEAAVDLLGLDTPASQAKGSPINDELDIFGPMVSNPLPSSNNTQQAKRAPQASDPSTSSSSSSTSTCTTTRAVEKKLLSKDSILSLYASSSAGSQPQSQQQPATGQGIHMGPPHITQQGFNSAMMEGGAMTSGMTRANGSYVDMRQNTHGIQQGQWSVGQLSQQMSGMATNGGAPPSGTSAASWSAAPTASGQTLSTQLWK
ncbi:stromal membrane-associated protein 1-like isoform X1 [Hippocampus comes]|uniref:stromal membrane-associated protein 1-like isoform X1 n=1 Tax=Hippocampus comes TaxID=109280 RepID=UPI00094F0A6A|nr:PREDICTED: stromal membrane-associated protein 1-like isoform X1 [Hippocampus comes]